MAVAEYSRSMHVKGYQIDRKMNERCEKINRGVARYL
jgi:hypothetical protein